VGSAGRGSTGHRVESVASFGRGRSETESVRRFHEAYVPQNALQVDASRFTYEVYYQDMMEYCVPVL
jgi:hypothetical protein